MAEVHISDIPEVIPDPPESVVPQEPVEPTPAAKKRGRPPGARNKPRIIVESLPTEIEPVEEDVEEEVPPTPEPKIRQRKPVVPVLSQPIPPSPAETFKAAMQAWQTLHAQERNTQGEHYHRLVSAMFK